MRGCRWVCEREGETWLAGLTKGWKYGRVSACFAVLVDSQGGDGVGGEVGF